ncbi:helix-turn-helix protein [Halanaerobium saccharolyticum]|uniref:Stage 0 sporulation protein A homolog n=1 Tax=Halanaerobium saccharolyticum TaxID=43595 RepID=A0A4R7Z1T2_9FIRM|nr:response regulator [Halanaerobium saccharolyticum]RAK06895.1 helix-turn-helix protein [Halanaerobium saccharolyticum]TDW01505.1 helix-turn-helix protein [Halanaerobium saccharolyticum]TDX52866.1 helix-turn-helix protein [Halanaerobium saccharolyticum]
MYRLIVVDDENEIRHALSNYIPWSEMDFKFVDSFCNGKKAYEFLQKNEIDVVLCDIKMPVMNGIELAERIYKDNLACKVVFLSAHKEFEFAQKALSFGVEDYVLKPTKYEELLDVFQKVKVKLNNECRNNLKTENKEVKCNDNYNKKLIKRIINYINNNYQNANLEEAAEIVHFSPSYLSKFFKDCTGENFSAYLNKVKMEKAKEYLQNVDYHVYQISEKLGYSNPKNFSRSFKKFTGQTPSQFRRGNNNEK